MRRTQQLAIPLPTAVAGDVLGISRVERETGLSKDTLRAWERRYGYPRPSRDAHGERAYSADQIEKLRLLRRLIERGLRPGKIIALGISELESLSLAHETPSPRTRDLSEFLEALREHDLPLQRRLLSRALMRSGLDAFVLDIVSPLCDLVAEERLRGDLEEFEARLGIELLQSVLQSAVQSLQHQGQPPRVIIASPFAESRRIERLMIEALLASSGALCVPLGGRIAPRDIATAAVAHHTQIVVADTPTADPKAAQSLTELRALLPSTLSVWAFGRSLPRLRRLPEGVFTLTSMDQLPALLQQWRRQHGQ